MRGEVEAAEERDSEEERDSGPGEASEEWAETQRRDHEDGGSLEEEKEEVMDLCEEVAGVDNGPKAVWGRAKAERFIKASSVVGLLMPQTSKGGAVTAFDLGDEEALPGGLGEEMRKSHDVVKNALLSAHSGGHSSTKDTLLTCRIFKKEKEEQEKCGVELHRLGRCKPPCMRERAPEELQNYERSRPGEDAIAKMHEEVERHARQVITTRKRAPEQTRLELMKEAHAPATSAKCRKPSCRGIQIIKKLECFKKLPFIGRSKWKSHENGQHYFGKIDHRLFEKESNERHARALQKFFESGGRQNSEDGQRAQDAQDPQDARDTQDMQDPQDAENARNSQDAQDHQGSQENREEPRGCFVMGKRDQAKLCPRHPEEARMIRKPWREVEVTIMWPPKSEPDHDKRLAIYSAGAQKHPPPALLARFHKRLGDSS